MSKISGDGCVRDEVTDAYASGDATGAALRITLLSVMLFMRNGKADHLRNG